MIPWCLAWSSQLDCLTLRRCSAINFIYIFTIHLWHVLTSFIFMLIVLWIFSTHPPFPSVHLFCSYLCRNQAISAPPAHKHNERGNSVFQQSLCLSNSSQHRWEGTETFWRGGVPFVSPKSYSSQVLPLIIFPANPPFRFKRSVAVNKECKTWAQSAPRTPWRHSGVGDCEQTVCHAEYADPYLNPQLWRV